MGKAEPGAGSLLYAIHGCRFTSIHFHNFAWVISIKNSLFFSTWEIDVNDYLTTKSTKHTKRKAAMHRE